MLSVIGLKAIQPQFLFICGRFAPTWSAHIVRCFGRERLPNKCNVIMLSSAASKGDKYGEMKSIKNLFKEKKCLSVTGGGQ